MKKRLSCLLVFLLFSLLFAGCADNAAEAGTSPPPLPPEPPAAAGTAAEREEDTEEPINAFDLLMGGSLSDQAFFEALLSDEMKAFEVEHAISEERARYLTFGAFILTNNRESIRVFPLNFSRGQAARLLSNSWGVTDGEGALVQLSSLANAEGQSPVADDIFRTFVRNGRLDPLDPFEVLFDGFDISGLENVLDGSRRRAERMGDEFALFAQALDAGAEDLDEAFDLFVLLVFTERINSGLEAYLGARALLIESFGFTEEELLRIESLAAWDYGRAAFIARYSVAAGYLEESETWDYLRLAAERAAARYENWREYTAAYVLGRALAFGSSSDDIKNTLDFLLNYDESPFRDTPFKG